MLLSRDVSIPFLGTNIAPRNVVGKMMLRSFRGDKICMQAATENLPWRRNQTQLDSALRLYKHGGFTHAYCAYCFDLFCIFLVSIYIFNYIYLFICTYYSIYIYIYLYLYVFISDLNIYRISFLFLTFAEIRFFHGVIAFLRYLFLFIAFSICQSSRYESIGETSLSWGIARIVSHQAWLMNRWLTWLFGSHMPGIFTKVLMQANISTAWLWIFTYTIYIYIEICMRILHTAGIYERFA